jgi:cell wall assembly regulator SMI1
VNREQWRPFLQRWSEEWIDSHDPEKERELDEAAVRDRWLGFAPASEEEIAAAEARLGRTLPPSLREFLAVTNGWRDAGCFIYRLAGTAEKA